MPSLAFSMPFSIPKGLKYTNKHIKPPTFLLVQTPANHRGQPPTSFFSLCPECERGNLIATKSDIDLGAADHATSNAAIQIGPTSGSFCSSAPRLIVVGNHLVSMRQAVIHQIPLQPLVCGASSHQASTSPSSNSRCSVRP
ncbi:hypothetical protein PIB30_096420 [Stylosanthes scabra]|uniref:Uncharacterized protein n=1 Tax=Stylosanthes scabra TaxID=79078 RepID=A0ABU6RVY4_9FABA|nr:hypothetical protein [Stylosanthes scabra]